MQNSIKRLGLLIACTALVSVAFAKKTVNNQTDQLSPVLSSTQLPFQVQIEQASFQLPVGFHSGALGIYGGMWIFIAGRINGLHGFAPTNNFPPDMQNTSIYVVNPANGAVYSRSLYDSSSGLNQQQIDSLSVTSPESYQSDNTLYLAGGYGVDTTSGTFGTKPVLTAIYLPGILNWVTQPGNKQYNVASNISQIYNTEFQVTGGKMYQMGNMTLLIFGQNFTGQYTTGSNGQYTEQVRLFQIKNANGHLAVTIYNSKPSTPNPVFRRRDLNILPTLLNTNGRLRYGFAAYAGVFTLSGGVWTVPVIIDDAGNPTMANPDLPATFKQAMNHYASASASLYSRKYTNMYHILLGGLSYGFYSGNVFETDSEVPFINQVTTIQMDSSGHFSQYLMNGQYPTIPSTGSNPGNPLLFGTAAYFVPANILQYPNGVINLDNIRTPTVIGYVVGGIMSTLPNTNTRLDSSASPYVFKVTLVPNA